MISSLAVSSKGSSGRVLAMALVITMLAATVFAEEIDWGSLELDPSQQSHMQQVESEWRQLCAELLPRIKRDREELKRLLNSPNADQHQILQLQQRISDNKQKLDQAALHTFLKKKQQLRPEQRRKLHKMMK